MRVGTVVFVLFLVILASNTLVRAAEVPVVASSGSSVADAVDSAEIVNTGPNPTDTVSVNVLWWRLAVAALFTGAWMVWLFIHLRRSDRRKASR